MIPIRSKQDGSPDSFDRDNIGDEVHADVIPDVKRKKNKRNITQDFNINGDFPQVFRNSVYNYENTVNDKVMNSEYLANEVIIPESEFVSKAQNSEDILNGDSEDFIFVQAKDENFTSENDEYESDEIYSSKDTHMMDFADRRSIPNIYDVINISKKKNTPLKSISTKTKESLSGQNKEIIQSSSFENNSRKRFESNIQRKVLIK